MGGARASRRLGAAFAPPSERATLPEFKHGPDETTPTDDGVPMPSSDAATVDPAARNRPVASTTHVAPKQPLAAIRADVATTPMLKIGVSFFVCLANGQRSPAAAQNQTSGRLVQRLLG